MAKLQLNFHNSFAFKKEDIIKIIRVAAEEKGLDDKLDNLMNRTGLGNAKVNPMITWASRAGLVQNKKLSLEGEIVNKFDPYLTSLNTEWLMHFYLSFGSQGINKIPENTSEWGGWPYFVYDFVPNNLSFNINYLEEMSKSVFDSLKSMKDDLRILLRTYTEDYALKSINFIKKVNFNKKTKINEYEKGNPNLPNAYLIGYFLAKLWERDFDNQTSVLTDEILFQKMGLAQVLGINIETLQEQFNKLESLGIIEQRRTVSPYQIIRRWDDPLTLLEKAYND